MADPVSPAEMRFGKIDDIKSRVAAAIDASRRQLFGGGTSISGAIDYSRLILAQSPFTATRRTIDVSGDGANNIGRPARVARDEAVRDGITINGLPILGDELYVDTFYFEHVIGGPGAVMVPADSYESFSEAILKKLIIEIASDDPEMLRAPLP